MNAAEIADRIENVIKKMEDKDVRGYDVNMLGRLALRCEEYIPRNCSHCPLILQNIDKWTKVLERKLRIPKEDEKDYFDFLNDAKRHMVSSHRLVSKYQYLIYGLPICLIIGLLIGWGMGQIGFGAILGVAVGILFGFIMDYRASKKNRII